MSGCGVERLESTWLRRLCLDLGADDAGFVGLDRPEVADQRQDILALFPCARTLISIVRRMSRENIRTPARSIANLEFHHAGDEVDKTARRIVGELERRGVRSMNGGAMGFPMEMDRWPGKTWAVSHKPVAVAACPTGAIRPDGHFNFSACYTHNYREFMGGFTDWVEKVADSSDGLSYRKKVSDAETVSLWQSLSFGANYKAAYCMSVCPAGEDVIEPFLRDRPQYLKDVVQPLQLKKEAVYVVARSDAEEHVARRFPNKVFRRVSNGVRPNSIQGCLFGLKLIFQPGQSKGLDVTFHFTFTGEEDRKATVVIKDQKLEVVDGHEGIADLHVLADSRTWIRFVGKETGLVWALLRGKIRLKGSPRLLRTLARCFPS